MPRKPARPTSPSGNAISKRADGRFQTWERLPGQAKRVYFYGATAEECRDKALAYLTDSKAGKVLAGGDRLTVGDLLAYWLAEVVPTTGAGPNTRANYAYLIGRHVEGTALAGVRLGRLGVPDVQSWLADRVRTGTAIGTIRRAKNVLSQALKWAWSADLVTKNAAALTRSPKDAAPPPEPLSLEEARKVLAVTRAHRRAALYEVALTYGLRRGELLGLKWSQVDFDRGRIALREQWKREAGKTIQGRLKTDSSRRELPLLPDVAAVLREHRARQNAERLADRLWRDEGYVFPGPHGRPLCPETISREFPALARAAIGRHVTLHVGARHGAASLMLAAGVPVEDVMAILGHASIAITINTYGHVRSGDKAAAVATLRRALGGDG